MDVTSVAGLEAVSLDHLGIMFAIAHELALLKKVDCPRYNVRRKVSNGQCTPATIPKGLGFSNHRLYLVPEFLQNKPVDRLIAPNMKPEASPTASATAKRLESGPPYPAASG